MKEYRRIGFDLDDVLINFNDSLLSYDNARFGTNHERDHRKSLDVSGLWLCDEDEAMERVIDFYRSEEHENIVPIEGSVEVIKKLKDNYKLFIVTARHDEIKNETLDLVEKHFPGMFDDVYFTNQYSRSGLKRSKGEICYEIGVKIFVDDSIHNAEDISSLGIPVLLFNTPWNQIEVREPIKRVHSWEEIENIIKALNLGD